MSFRRQSYAMTGILKNLTILNGSLPIMVCHDTTFSSSVNLTTTDAGTRIVTNTDLSGGIRVDLTILNSNTRRLTHKNTILAPFINLTMPQCRIRRASTNSNTGACLTSQETLLQQCMPPLNIDRIKVVH